MIRKFSFKFLWDAATASDQEDGKGESIIDFLAEMIDFAKSKRARNPVTLLPVYDDVDEFNPWEPIVIIHGPDIIGADPSWYLHNKDCRAYVSSQMKCTMEICSPRNLTPHFWAQGFGIPSGREHELETGFSLAVERGAKSIAIWGMHGNAA